jgi:hypothetical protein
VVNEERLASLSDEAFAELRRRQYLPAIYAQLISLGQMERLGVLKDRRTAGPTSAA